MKHYEQDYCMSLILSMIATCDFVFCVSLFTALFKIVVTPHFGYAGGHAKLKYSRAGFNIE